MIPGVEISANYDGNDIHILGYYIDLNNKIFLDTLVKICNARLRRVDQIIDALYNLGIKIDLQKIIDFNGSKVSAICRPHIAQAMIEAGVVKTQAEAFDKYLGFGKPAYFSKEVFNHIEAIQLILSANGVPVLAHPGINICNQNNALIDQLIIDGLLGIEVYYPEHTSKQVRRYNKIAKKNKLIITGGSDFHGFYDNSNLMGTMQVNYTVVEDIKRAR